MIMTRDLKALGLALFAICALGAVGAQGASAAKEHEFHSDGQETVITGKTVGTTKFAVGSAGTIECTTGKYEATQIAEKEVGPGTYASDTLTVVPHYSGCTFGGQPATVSFNHCAIVLDSDTTEGNPTGGEHANVETECSEGSKVEIDTSVCTITIGAQLVKHAARYENDTASSFTVNTTAHKVVTGKQKTTESQTGCLLFPTGAIGTFVSTSTYECFKDEGTTLIGTEKTTPTEKTVEGPTTECKVSNL
jgi:hypothetical protein